MTFTIEKGVPIPVRLGTRETIYPFADMVPGDSFTVPVADGKTVLVQMQAIRSRAATWAKRHAPGAKFATRAEEGGKAVRIWMLTRPASLAPIANLVVPPPSVAGRVHKLEDDEGESPKKRAGPAAKFAHDIPAFLDGAKPRKVAGKRY